MNEIAEITGEGGGVNSCWLDKLKLTSDFDENLGASSDPSQVAASALICLDISPRRHRWLVRPAKVGRASNGAMPRSLRQLKPLLLSTRHCEALDLRCRHHAVCCRVNPDLE